ncbi:acyl-CoA carboxylase epsilon subunit [Agromyces sp. G08B096]|uniref:Acyl-CoA carboxylase epsilon subunit n=1 Tax=Agromyces sp. G08B096 TaxID=3156399 RepID=A0AAU7W5W6_9MICO
MTDDTTAPDLRFLTSVSAEEAAAATAVLLAAMAEHTDTPTAATGDDRRWVRGAGALRAPLTAGPGRWASWGR